MCEHEEFVITYTKIFGVCRESRQCLKCGLIYPSNRVEFNYEILNHELPNYDKSLTTPIGRGT